MAVSNDLYDLIKTMLPSEKKFFRNNTFKDKKKSYYLKMFDYIEKQAFYDEEILLVKMKKINGFSNLSTSKNYLYKILIACLIKYNEPSEINFRIRIKINEIELLRKKGLFKKALSKTQKVLAFCKEHELLSFELELQMLLVSINSNYSSISNIDFSDCNSSIEKYKNSISFDLIKFRIIAYVNDLGNLTDNNVGKKIFQELKNFIHTEPLLSDERNALTFNSKLLFNTFNSHWHSLNKDVNESYNIIKKVVVLIEENFNKFIFFPSMVISTYGNYISLCSNVGKSDELLKSIQNLKSLINKSKNFDTLKIRARIFEISSVYEIQHHLNKSNINSCKLLINKYEKEFNALKVYMNTSKKYDFYAVASKVYFYLGENIKSLEYTQELIYSEKEEINDQLTISAYMLSIILYFEEEMYSLMKSNMRSLKRIITKKERFGEEDLLLFKFLNELLKTPKNEQTTLFNELLLKIELMEKKGFSFNLYYFKIILWIKSRAFKKEIFYQVKEENRLQ